MRVGGELLESLPRTRPAQHRADPGQELAQREGLGDVVVGSKLEAADAVGFLSPRREHDDRHVDTFLPERATHVPPAHPGHHDVEQDEIGGAAQGERQRLLAVGGRRGLVALEAKIVLEAAHDLGLVVHDQDLGHHAPLRGRRRAKRLPAPGLLSTATSPP